MLTTLALLFICVFTARTRWWWFPGLATMAAGALFSALPRDVAGLESWFVYEFLIGPAVFVVGLGAVCLAGSFLVRAVVEREASRLPALPAPRVRVLPAPMEHTSMLGLAGLRLRPSPMPIRAAAPGTKLENSVISEMCPGVSLTASGSHSRFKRSAG
jgi:hypothetical protein